MRAWHRVVGTVLALLVTNGAETTPAAAQSAPTKAPICQVEMLDTSDLAGVRIVAADFVGAGGFVPPRSTRPLVGAPAFCRVQAQARPSGGSVITFEVWVPLGWNGKIVTTGNGGYSNALSYRDMAYALAQGYATIGGDTGHQTPTPDDMSWGAGNADRIMDWGSRSIHVITEPGKQIVERMAGAAPRRTYFYGCSTGGHQAYAEMQRYPQDFDGVVAGAPGNNRVRLNAGFLWQFLANHRRGDNDTPILPVSKLPTITRAVLAACDARDGVADGVVDDPRECPFDPTTIACTSADQPTCLTAPQIEALNRMYAGARNPRTGDQVYPGWPKSSEALTVSADGSPSSGWHQYWGRREPMRVEFWRTWLFGDPKWDWWSFDFDQHIAEADERLGRLIDQNSTDLSVFKARGGKAIVYQGWQDPVVNAIDTIAYYERLRARQGSQEETDRFFRLFMVPGMGHCGGGPGATVFGNAGTSPPRIDAEHDLLMALDAWVERGQAPDRLVASQVTDGTVTRTRPLCTYPKRAMFAGTGSPAEAASFHCR